MLTPQELYYQYSTDPCEFGSKGLDNEQGYVGKGTPYDLTKLANFLKQLKYPCYTKAPFTQTSQVPKGILNSGAGKLAIPFKFLQRLDVEAFTEIQPDIRSGTSHAIRNACDIMRACFLEAKGERLKWDHRGATEHIEFFGKNSITDCLMVLGPDLVPEAEALLRGTGCGPLDCLKVVGQLPRKEGVGLGAGFGCRPPPGKESKGLDCTSCDDCPEDPGPNPPECCRAQGCEAVVRVCCGDPTGQRTGVWDFRQVATNNVKSKSSSPLKHVGILKRKSYGGYGNFLNNSGSLFYACPPDLFLQYFQTLNQYDYTTHQAKTETRQLPTGEEYIDRVRTISLVLPVSTTITVAQQVKDLIYNGYGVVIMTNLGFPNKRDSSGLSYPDRIFYHSYAVIGYDDTKKEFNECVYLLANSWGKWNSGGHPSWGPIPDGSFLVTESHFNCMTTLFRADQEGCKKTTEFKDGQLVPKPGCFKGQDDSCSPWFCEPRQRSTGLVFALSLVDGFPKQNLDYSQFYKPREFYSN